MHEELLTVKEVAARLKVNPQTVRRWIRAGRLPVAPIAMRGYRIRERDVAPRGFVPPPEPTAEQLGRRRQAFDRLLAIRQEIAERGGLAEPSLQEMLDENRFELDLRTDTVRRPPPLTAEERAEQRAAMAKLRSSRIPPSGQGPTLQELLDERRHELEE